MTPTKDLGTYHLRVEFDDGRGYIQSYHTGSRFDGGRDGTSPLEATKIPPTWKDEAELFECMVFSYTEGNYSCDCNRNTFLAWASQSDRSDDECGDTIKLQRLTAIRPDGSEVVLLSTPSSIP